MRRYMRSFSPLSQHFANHTEVHSYESFDEMIEGCRESYQKGYHIRTIRELNSSFVGRKFTGLDDILQKSKETWEEGLAAIQRITEQLQEETLSRPTSRRRKMRFNEDDGDEVDSDRLRDGNSAFWKKAKREVTTSPQMVSIFVDCATPAFRSSESIFWRGAAAIVLANLLENAGYNVELVGMSMCQKAFRNGDDLLTTVVLKQSSTPLDIATIANNLSGWCYRTIWFQSHYNTERASETEENMGYALEASGRSNVSDGRYLKLTGRENVRSVMIEQVFTEDSALQLIKEVLKEFTNEA